MTEPIVRATQHPSVARPVPVPPPVVAVRHVRKQFESVVALHDVSLEAHAGRVLALLGDNGAGKSTLIKILSGVYQPTSGTLEVDGQPMVLQGPHHARRLGISTVFQELAVCELLSISRNVVLGNEPRRHVGPFSWFDVHAAERIAANALETLGVDLRRSMNDPAATLSGGQRQAIAIARAIYYGSRCLILDEPTAALAVRQTRQVLDQVVRARDAGQAVILITHNMQQALSVADEVVVLARGRIVGSYETAEGHLDEITALVARG
jgi:simple sugar transport system ATP-binding protein